MFPGKGYINDGCFDSIFGHGYYSWWFPIIGIAVTALIIILVVVLLRRSARVQKTDSALDLLKLQYVKGEITEEEYQRKKTVLNQK